MLPWKNEGFSDPFSWLAYRRKKHEIKVIGRYDSMPKDIKGEKEKEGEKKMDTKKILLVVAGVVVAYILYKKFAK